MQQDAAVVEDLRRAAAAAGDHLATVEDHGVGEVQGAVLGAQAGERTAAGMAAAELRPEQVAALPVGGGRRVRTVADRPEPPAVVVDHHQSRSSRVQHLTAPPDLCSSERSTPIGSKPRERSCSIRPMAVCGSTTLRPSDTALSPKASASAAPARIASGYRSCSTRWLPGEN